MKKIFFYFPCILLIGVAISQIYITQSEGFLTPAKGGGFGMFSTVDKLNNRALSVYGIFDKNQVNIRIDTQDPYFKKNLQRKWQKARSYPSNSNLRDLGRALSNLKLSQRPDYLKIEVKKCTFDNKEIKVKYQLVNELTIPFRPTK